MGGRMTKESGSTKDVLLNGEVGQMKVARQETDLATNGSRAFGIRVWSRGLFVSTIIVMVRPPPEPPPGDSLGESMEVLVKKERDFYLSAFLLSFLSSHFYLFCCYYFLL
ncbi:unnamed protein product [Cuscuta epithymum]|uniref:Uncharacterized protein n=1 Tax=Cuscuta epithymum TaxID=186058 RepID=A0AAV0BXN5_9ASTE|nr:unnamed protein product [Cuscuta epithymum]